MYNIYKIMHQEKIIALANESEITEIMEKSLCPHCFFVGFPLKVWLDNRCVDTHRSHSRRLFKALRLKTSEDMAQVIDIGHGISITDNWWVQKSNEALEYHSLKRYNEELADIALLGSSTSDSGDISGYRELGTVGSYEKAWRFIDGAWYMYKQGNIQELISEYYAYLFLSRMQFPVAEYSIEKIKSAETGLQSTFIRSKDFTNNAEVDFEPFCNYFGDNEEPDFILPKLPDVLITPYVMTLFYDALLFNGDRHNQNIGVLRSSSTGALIGLSPAFDFNLGLIATGVPRVDGNTGNVFTSSFLRNAICVKVLKENLPDRNLLLSAIKYASDGVRDALAVSDFNYALIENYILDTYDFFASKLY